MLHVKFVMYLLDRQIDQGRLSCASCAIVFNNVRRWVGTLRAKFLLAHSTACLRHWLKISLMTFAVTSASAPLCLHDPVVLYTR